MRASWNVVHHASTGSVVGNVVSALSKAAAGVGATGLMSVPLTLHAVVATNTAPIARSCLINPPLVLRCERATRAARAGEAARASPPSPRLRRGLAEALRAVAEACRGVRGAKPLGEACARRITAAPDPRAMR